MYVIVGCVLGIVVVVVVFFQAEDGIRDLVRSRGLGDVYKRQDLGHGADLDVDEPHRQCHRADDILGDVRRHLGAPVSYTHLTLPTSDLV